MNIFDFEMLLRLIIAHVLSDFILQPDKWVKDKKERKILSKFFLFHGLVLFVLTWIALGTISLFWLAFIITIIHLIIDLGKAYLKSDNFWIFLLDQFCHFITLVLAWSLYTNQSGFLLSKGTNLFWDQKILILITGYLIVTFPTSKVIWSLIKKWSHQDDQNQNSDESLKGGGKIIGILERVLIFTFVYLNQFEAIGLLLAAKSV